MQVAKDVTAAILFNDQKVLIAQRAQHDPLAGLWEFPGGKIEVGESPEECLAREMREEFSIEVEVGDFLGSSLFTYGKGPIRLLAYISKWIGGELRSTVHQDFAWVSINELEHYTFAPADIPLVEKLRGNHYEF